jgi:hypothetical protein
VPLGPLQQNVGAGYPKFGSTLNDFQGRFSCFWGFNKVNFEAGFTVKALFDGSIVTGKLKLVFPFELQTDLFERTTAGFAMTLTAVAKKPSEKQKDC